MAASRPDTRDELLNAAEVAVRERGYHGVSFRELADDIGIKSASVHYYFPQKENLGVALVERYEAKFFEKLEQASVTAQSPRDQLIVFCDVYRASLGETGHACLCGMLGAESCGLPPPVTQAVAAFFKANLSWLHKILPSSLPQAERESCAAEILAALQGGMMLATALNDKAILDGLIERILANADARG